MVRCYGWIFVEFEFNVVEISHIEHVLENLSCFELAYVI